MLVGRPLAQVVNPQIERAVFLRALHHAFRKRGATDLGKKRQDIDAHLRNVECRMSNVEPVGRDSVVLVGRDSVEPEMTRSAPRSVAPPKAKRELLNDLERGALPVTRRRTGQQRADRLNGLAVAADDSTHIRLTQLHSEDRCLSRRNLGEHHLIRKFDELTDDELEKLFHDSQAIQTSPFVIDLQGAAVSVRF